VVTEPGSTSARRFYVAAGLALCLGYFGAVFVGTRGNAAQALRSTVVAVVPGVILAAVALRLARRAGASRARHVLIAIGFAVAWNACLVAGFAAEHRLSGEPGAFKMRLESLGFGLFTGLLIYASVAGIAFALETGARLRQAEALATRAELAALRAKLNPHFLFNTLHTVMGLLRRDPALAEEALQDLGDVLRYALDVQRGHEHVTLRDELAIVERYLAIERLRLGDRLRVETQVSQEALSRRLPAFTLQPLIENAIRYAVAPRATGGRVRLEAAVKDGVARAGGLRRRPAARGREPRRRRARPLPGAASGSRRPSARRRSSRPAAPTRASW
jgi:hypothetical protein